MTIPERRLSALDAMRVSPGLALLSLSHRYGRESAVVPEQYGKKTVGSGSFSHREDEGGIRATVTGADGDRAAFRTNVHFAADSLRVVQELYHSSAGQTNQVRRWGLFDDENGVYFELSGTTVAVGWRSYVTGEAIDTNVVQAAWGGDQYNGTGTAGTLDITKTNIYEISLHRTTGEVRFFINGFLVHTLSKYNVLAVPFMGTTRLPSGIDIENTGSSTGASVTCLYQGVFDESGGEPNSVSFGKSHTLALAAGGKPIFSVRPKEEFNSVENRGQVVPRQLVIGASAVGKVQLVLDGTLTGANFSDVDEENSQAQADTSATAITDGKVIAEYRIPAGVHPPIDLAPLFGRAKRVLSLKAYPNSDQDTLTVVGFSDTGTPTGYASLVWDEIR